MWMTPSKENFAELIFADAGK